MASELLPCRFKLAVVVQCVVLDFADCAVSSCGGDTTGPKGGCRRACHQARRGDHNWEDVNSPALLQQPIKPIIVLQNGPSHRLAQNCSGGNNILSREEPGRPRGMVPAGAVKRQGVAEVLSCWLLGLNQRGGCQPALQASKQAAPTVGAGCRVSTPAAQ